MWQQMSVDEFAEFEISNGESLVKVDGIWWKRVRPFFYQQLFPFRELAQQSFRAPWKAYVGGYQYTVPENVSSNSRMHFLVFDDLPHYDIGKLSANNRMRIRKGLRALEAREVIDLEELRTSGYEAYLSFYRRTQYSYGTERLDRENFEKWARNLLRFPKVKILGGYLNGKLSAINISYLVDRIVYYASYFAHEDSLKYQISDLIVHQLRLMAANRSDVEYIFMGRPTGKSGLDDFKLSRGCRILSKSACFRLNPAAEVMLRSIMPDKYRKLTGALDMEDPPRQESAGEAT
jgi:hypothetical protein